ncbi:DUF3857 domain-containing protein [Mucilaginibacter auburnensis]|uniref:Uncharacterized protein DUF3857 n=1 Tax=Mucilaginibacter auburnensis TaxID=1457233 RepID=A0A2H9VVM4_9SPHI|nr:DUF3857 domain-containing protein [Mucilaginibacter auburnensis]PJJ84867.1 uncharacterized protein DUF3857 [Mucilaginibacter auburnensis]
MRRFFLLSVFCFFFLTTYGQDVYTASTIPKEMLPYASAVVREEIVTTDIKAVDNVIYNVRRTITILNNNGDDEAEITIFHDKANSIKDIRGVVYDEFGKQISKFSTGNFQDRSAVSNYSLFEDSRIKYYQPQAVAYPYTISYEYEVRSKQSLNLHDWQPVQSTGVAVQKSSFTVIARSDFKITYKESNLTDAVTITSGEGGAKVYNWKASNIKAMRSEPYSPDPDLYRPGVKIALEKFSYGGISGTYANWSDLGKWNYDKLINGRQNLSPETIGAVKTLIAGVTDPKEKARRIYDYMQRKTHYVSIQIGIGGYQPMLASDVDRLNYGDCKALVNYMQALLKVADIESWYCAVAAGYSYKTSLLPDFASMGQANHVILCIPFANDTTWLECTSQKIPFGFLSNFTDDRNVLACTPQGGKLLHTPKYNSIANLQVRTAAFKIEGEGELSGSIETSFSGTQYENREELMEKSETERLKLVPRIYAINNLAVNKYGLTQSKTDKPLTKEVLSFSAPSYASTVEDKLIFLINAINRTGRAPAELRTRLTNLYINDGYADEDEIVYTLPADNYRSEKMPLNVSITRPFGSYNATMELKGQQLVYHRKITLLAGTYDKALYNDFVDFYRRVADADAYSAVLSKK